MYYLPPDHGLPNARTNPVGFAGRSCISQFCIPHLSHASRRLSHAVMARSCFFSGQFRIPQSCTSILYHVPLGPVSNRLCWAARPSWAWPTAPPSSYHLPPSSTWAGSNAPGTTGVEVLHHIMILVFLQWYDLQESRG